MKNKINYTICSCIGAIIFVIMVIIDKGNINLAVISGIFTVAMGAYIDMKTRRKPIL